MFCRNCGFKLVEGMNVCPSCGTAVENTAGQQTENNYNQSENGGVYGPNNINNQGSDAVNNSGNYYGYNNGNNVYNNQSFDNQSYNNPNLNGNNSFTTPGQYPYGYYNNQMQPNQPKKKSGGKVAVIIIVCVVLAVGLGAGAYFLFFGNSQGNQHKEPITNSKGGGIDSDVYQDYEDNPFYENPFEDEELPTIESTTEADPQLEGDLDFYKGTITENVYHNEFFGLVYNVPSDYYVLTESEIQTAYGLDNTDLTVGVIGINVLDESDNELAVHIQKLGMSFEDAAYYYIQSLVTTSTSVIDENTFVTSDIEYIDICGVEFAKCVVELTEYDESIQYKYTEFLVTEKDGMVMIIRSVYDETDQGEAMLDNFSAVKWFN